MKADYVHFLPEAWPEDFGAAGRKLGGSRPLVKAADADNATAYFWCRHPLKIGANAVVMYWPTAASYKFGATWVVFYPALPPAEVIATKEANYTESALIRLSEDYWKGFIRLDPKFAIRNAPAYVETPGSFDECFRKVSVPLARNFKRDMTVIWMWKTWKSDLNMTYDLAAQSLRNQFDISGEMVRKLGDKYDLPSWHNG